MRNRMIELYLDWRNNFLTVERFAEYHGLHVTDARDLLTIARRVFESNHPEA